MTYALNLILAAIPQGGPERRDRVRPVLQDPAAYHFAAFGVRDAITPIVSFNFGMRSRTRVQQGIHWGLGYTAALMLLGCLGVELFCPAAGRAILTLRHDP